MRDRRTILRGLAAFPIAGGSAAATVPVAGSADTRLVELAEAYAAVERRCDEHIAAHRHLTEPESEAADQAFATIAKGFGPIEKEVGATPADGMVGLLAKARFLQVPSARGYHCVDVALSLADDLLRLFGASS